MVEEDRRVDGTATEADLEMEVRGRGASCLSREADDFPRLHFLSRFDEVFRLVAVTCGETEGVTDDDIVAVAEIRSSTV